MQIIIIYVLLFNLMQFYSFNIFQKEKLLFKKKKLKFFN